MLTSLVNLKSSNGMFYFGAEYVRKISAEGLIWVPVGLVKISSETFCGSTVVDVGAFGLVRVWMRLLLEDIAVFTPTPHPLPFIDRQLVVVHDSYPFQGRVGRIKRWLFRISLATSRCKVAYINHSDSRRFVESCVSDPRRRVFLPNHYPLAATSQRSRLYRGGNIVVGLLGTDSPKKDYASLFAACVKRGLKTQIQFVAFGHDTAYFRAVRTAYPEVQVRLVSSDAMSLPSFFDTVDCLVSVAHNEGFGRPIAYAIAAGVPCFLIEDEVFREFYSGLATFAPTVDDVISSMLVSNNHAPRQLDSANFPPPTIRLAIKQGVDVLKAL